MQQLRFLSLFACAAVGVLGPAAWSGAAHAQCPPDTTVQHYSGLGGTPCPCFNIGEEMGSVFNPPAEHYPLEVLRVGIGWGSVSGATGQSLEGAVKVYNGDAAAMGSPIFTLVGPVMNDGVINEFNLEAEPGEITVDSGPVSVTLEILNTNNGNTAAPAPLYDTGCQLGKNLVFAIPGGWFDACLLLVPGDWITFMVYRPCLAQTGIADDPILIANVPLALAPPSPNPIRGAATLEFFLSEPGEATIRVFDVSGRLVETVLDSPLEAGVHTVSWLADEALRSGIYFLVLESGGHRTTQKALIAR